MMQVFLNKIYTFPESYVVRHSFEISAEGLLEIVILETIGQVGVMGKEEVVMLQKEHGLWP